MSTGNTLSSNHTETALTTELSSTNTNKNSLTIYSTESTLTVIDETKKARPYKVNTVICCAITFMILGKIVIPILVALSFAFEFEIVGPSPNDSVLIAECYNINNDKTPCRCENDSPLYNNESCEINMEGSYIEISIALNTMVLVVETLWFIRMLFGLRRHSLCHKLGIFQAIAQLTRDSKCCLSIWRIFELIWYIAIVAQYTTLKCNCVETDDTLQTTKAGKFYEISYYLDLTALTCITLYLLTKLSFYCSMAKITKTAGAYYDMGAFFAVLKVYYFIDGKSFGREESVSVWSPLKQREEDIKYEAQNLKLHYKGWR